MKIKQNGVNLRKDAAANYDFQSEEFSRKVKDGMERARAEGKPVLTDAVEKVFVHS